MDHLFDDTMARWEAELQALLDQLSADFIGNRDLAVEVRSALAAVGEERLRSQSKDNGETGFSGVPFWDRNGTVDGPISANVTTLPSGRIVTANASAVKLFNLPARRVIGQPLLVFIAKEERSGFVQAFSSLKRPGGFETAEWIVNIQPCLDSHVPVVFRAQALRSESGALIQIHCSLFTHPHRASARFFNT